MVRQYVKDRWDEKELIISYTGKDIIAVGEVLEDNAEKFLHFKTEDFIKITEMILKEYNSVAENEGDKNEKESIWGF